VLSTMLGTPFASLPNLTTVLEHRSSIPAERPKTAESVLYDAHKGLGYVVYRLLDRCPRSSPQPANPLRACPALTLGWGFAVGCEAGCPHEIHAPMGK